MFTWTHPSSMSTRLVMGPAGQCMGFGKRGQVEGARECGDSKPLTKLPLINRLCSAFRCLWNILHLLPRQGTVKQKSLIFWGQDLLPLPFQAMKYVDYCLPGLVTGSSRTQWNIYTAWIPMAPSSEANHPLWSVAHSVWPMFLLQKQLSRALRTYERRIEWLSLASRRIWGTVCEKRYLLSSSVLVLCESHV